MKKILFFLFVFVSAVLTSAVFAEDADFAGQFANPPAEYHPWVYWFWNNGNLTKEGITADLEAMKRVGVGGVLIMEVGQAAPRGPADFMSEKWRELFKFMIAEANRLGIKVNMNNDAGWNGSGGWWIKPQDGMQILVFTETQINAEPAGEIILNKPADKLGRSPEPFYRDIAVLAFPTPKDLTGRKALSPDKNTREVESKAVVAKSAIIDLTNDFNAETNTLKSSEKLKNENSKLITILRIGHTCKGNFVGPPPIGGSGLECDKLSVRAADAAFNGQMGVLMKDNAAFSGAEKTLMATHIDSWENGSQNWTEKMREEFQKYRNYDIVPFLPVFAGYIVDSVDTTDRFLWDFRYTVSQLVLNNYVRRFSELSHQHNIKLSIEAYGAPTDPMEYGGIADEPMGEFWCAAGAGGQGDGNAMPSARGMASVSHIYGKPVTGAEAFTAGNNERWLRHPGNIKILGDSAFAEGIQRFVFHRYSFQPWKDIKPGLMMGPWGLHYERTNTWWEQSKPWHEYLARCQYMLRQGEYQADILYMENEDAAYWSFSDHPRKGYQWDQCSAHIVKQLNVKDGKIIAPSGAEYRILALQPQNTMTLELLEKITQLIKDGATVLIKNKPISLPGLSYSEEQKQKFNTLVSSLPISSQTPEEVLKEKDIKPVLKADNNLHWIYRKTKEADIYFAANPLEHFVNIKATFRTAGKPDLYYPETGKIVPASAYKIDSGNTTVLLPLNPAESVFVVFNRQNISGSGLTAVRHNGKPVFDMETASVKKTSVIKIISAKYGPPEDLARTIDVKDKLQNLIDSGAEDFLVAEMAKPKDPAFMVLKTLTAEYEIDGNKNTYQGVDTSRVNLYNSSGDEQIAVPNGNTLDIYQSGEYELTFNGFSPSPNGTAASKLTVEIPAVQELIGDWELTFSAKKITMPLVSWSDSADDYVKYFSGTAAYKRKFASRLPSADSRIFLDLGKVEVIAEVKLNSKSIGTLWTAQKRADITDFLKDGENELEIMVTNLWVNRLIGDAKLPQDAERQPNGQLSAYPQWLLDGKPIPDGRTTFCMWNLWGKDEKPVPSGLLGPVKIITVKKVPLK